MDISVIDATKLTQKQGFTLVRAMPCQNDRIYQCSLSLLQKMV